MSKLTKQKTAFSCMWQIRLFRRDWLFGYIKIAEVAETGEFADPNEIEKLSQPTEGPK